MDKDEFIKYVESNKKLDGQIEEDSIICAIIEILVKKGICENKEFQEIKKKYRDNILDDSYAKLNNKELEAMKTINSFMKDMLWGK